MAATGKTRYPGVRWRDTSRGRTFQARWRSEDGRAECKGGFKSAKDAADYLSSKHEEMRRGTYVSPARERTTWKTVADAWLQSRESKGRKPSTLLGYRRILGKHLGHWDNLAIGRISTTDVTELWERLHNRGLSVQTRHNIANVASGVFAYAERQRMISSNPARVVREDLPSRKQDRTRKKEQVRFLNPSQVAALADAVEAVSTERHRDEARASADALLVRFAAWSGLRSGEVAGLRVRAVDELRSAVKVTESISKINGELLSVEPKTDHSWRTVPLPPALVREVLEYTRARGLGPDGYIWGDGEQPRDMRDFYLRVFKPATIKAALPGVRFHDLRHSYASIQASQGHKGHEVSKWLGHSTTAFTMDTYVHLFVDEEAHAARALRLDAAYLASPTPTNVRNLGRNG